MQTVTAPDEMTQATRKKILVVDDHPLMRQGLAMLINQQQDMQVCAEAEDAHAALMSIAQKSPDIVILDISLKGPDGLDLLKSIRTTHSNLPVLILSMHDEAIYAERALRARANGYIMKQEATEKVLVAVRRILNGDVYLSDAMSSRMLHQYIDGAPSLLQSRIAALSDRELEVFRRIGEGQATRQIAEELHLSVKTVETYQAHLKEKLALRTGRELIQHAIQWKINEMAS
ncbi:MAG: response regulator transcription factor [Terracidiphilus sp.]|jgi:DNA-binding NarL/FixJ family response regulator